MYTSSWSHIFTIVLIHHHIHLSPHHRLTILPIAIDSQVCVLQSTEPKPSSKTSHHSNPLRPEAIVQKLASLTIIVRNPSHCLEPHVVIRTSPNLSNDYLVVIRRPSPVANRLQLALPGRRKREGGGRKGVEKKKWKRRGRNMENS